MTPVLIDIPDAAPPMATFEEMAAVIEAARMGKTIQYSTGFGWLDTVSPNFNFGMRRYRVKP
jgi:hypothetical protein